MIQTLQKPERRQTRTRWILFLLLLIVPALLSAQSTLPSLNLSVGEATEPGEFSLSIQILALLTVLSLAPSILIMMTSFTRLIVVFHFLRAALAAQSTPSNQVLVSLALFITFFIMKPVFNDVYENAWQPLMEEEITQKEALQKARKPIAVFMLNHTREKDLGLFVDLSGEAKPESVDDLPITTIIPAFIISELKTSFQIGFLLYLPMLVIDMIVASLLLSMGMMMLPPIMISMPFKILLFVLVDGWYL
ncbi:MAG: flagellar type III secretion system pore protein FliP, partial [Candidatus Marinimicrobia bacterium]|nr:flagellar type III secretion system pore protein FliP [Candidatus Neomarinimicrobiota bacterium]